MYAGISRMSFLTTFYCSIKDMSFFSIDCVSIHSSPLITYHLNIITKVHKCNNLIEILKLILYAFIVKRIH